VEQRKRQEGFVVSTEIMLIALILVAGLVTGWVKLRDQSLAEIKDSMAAIDAYILGSTPLWQIGGTRWIVGGAVIEPTVPAVSELWGEVGSANWDTAFPAAVQTSADPLVFEATDGILVYDDDGTGEGNVPVIINGSTTEGP
jgi:hypothetical protein